MVRGELIVAVAASLVGAAATARAAEPLPALVVTRSAGATDCPDAVTLSAEVARMNGKPSLDPSGGSAAATRLHVQISRGNDGYAAVIRALGARTGERRLGDLGQTCSNLSDALALTLAIILDNDARSVSIDPSAHQDSGSPGARSTGPGSPPRSLGGDFGAAAGVHTGALAETGLFATAQARLLIGAFALEAGGFIAPEQTVAHRSSAGRLALQLASGFFGACLRVTSTEAPAPFWICIEPHVGSLRGAGTGFDEERPPQHHLWLAAALALDLGGAVVAPVHWYARTSALVVSEQRFVASVDGTDENVFQSSPAALLASAGLRVRFE